MKGNSKKMKPKKPYDFFHFRSLKLFFCVMSSLQAVLKKDIVNAILTCL